MSPINWAEMLRDCTYRQQIKLEATQTISVVLQITLQEGAVQIDVDIGKVLS